MPRKARRPPKASSVSAAKPARFGIEHFFQRRACSSSQSQQQDDAVKKDVACVVKEQQEEIDRLAADPGITGQQNKEEEGEQGEKEQGDNLDEGNGHRKRAKLPTAEVSPRGSEEADDEIVWKASPVAERWQSGLSLRPCSTRSKVEIDCDKENVPTSQPTSKQKLSKLPSPAPQLKDSAVKTGLKRQGKRKALLDLLDQVKLVVSDDVEAGPRDDESARSDEHIKNCQIAEERKPNINYVVLEATESEYQRERDHAFYPQKVLRLLDERNMVEKLVYLRDEWNFSVVRPGDTVNVIGDLGVGEKCVVDRQNNLLVLHPDVLISGSRVGSSFSCSRRAVLHDRLKSSDTSMAALLGTMLHRLFQAALTAQNPSFEYLEKQARRIVLEHIDGLFAVAGNETEAIIKLVDTIPSILDWLQSFKHSKESENNVDFGVAAGKRSVSISEVVDIEEMILSPKYGLKGMLDVSLRVDDGYMPLEFKTGKATMGQAGVEHRAQVILYTLLMSDRYSQNVNKGILYYLHTKQTLGIEVQHADVTGLMMRRNEHASHLRSALSTQSLPPMLQSSHACQRCPLIDVCTVYHKLHDSGTAETSGLGESFDAWTAHLNRKHGQFLRHWEYLIDLEAELHFSSQSEIWRNCSSQREERGRCLSSMSITTCAADKEKPGSITYCFKKATVSQKMSCSCDQIFSLGDYVLLSTESGYFAVAGGIVKSTERDSLTVSIPRPLRLPGGSKGGDRIFKELWRLDRDDSSSSFAIMRYNILQLFVRDGARRCRDLIVDLEAPVFDNIATSSQDPASSYLSGITDINEDQRSAVAKVLCARDYCLILGMPGTGKTSTIVHAVRALLARGMSILLASYTNSAVDNILLKLKCQGVDFVRVGRPEAIHPGLAQHALGAGVTSVEDLSQKINQARVVGATCLGITHPLFTRRKFDVCIVDEAGQITLPVCLGPLRYARTFVLVGDHYQLPPLIQNAEAREKGMDVSLFRTLSEAHPQAVVALECQYRMSESIMNLSNVLIYGNRLRCGSAEVANARLHVNISNGLPAWIQQALDSSRSVIFIDADHAEKHHTYTRHNYQEGSIVIHILRALTKGGVDPRSVGVISPYKAQVDHIKSQMSNNGLSNVEVDTIDRYQGRDKDCILISFALSLNQRDSRSLLTDWHRINVAITRAKKKLIMVGSVKALCAIPLLKLLIEQVKDQGGQLNLAKNYT